MRLSSINKLEESNWIKYKCTMWFYLISKELWYLLQGTEKKEKGLNISAEHWQKYVNNLCVILLSSIHEDNISLIVKVTDPAKIWAGLKHTHMNTSSCSKFYYLKLLMNTSYVDGEDVGTHLTTIRKNRDIFKKAMQRWNALSWWYWKCFGHLFNTQKFFSSNHPLKTTEQNCQQTAHRFYSSKCHQQQESNQFSGHVKYRKCSQSKHV